MSERRLWIVRAEWVFVMEADEEPESVDLCVDMMTDAPTYFDAEPLNNKEDIPHEWRGNCFPWGSEGDKTVEEILGGSDD